MTWKGFVLIFLVSFITSSTSVNETTPGRRAAAMILGLYGLGLPAVVFALIDMGILFG